MLTYAASYDTSHPSDFSSFFSEQGLIKYANFSDINDTLRV